MDTIAQVMALFKAIDQQTSLFCEKTQLQCVSGCAACCFSPDIQTTVAEMMPAANWLIKTKQAQGILDVLATQQPQGQCVFLVPDQSQSGHGRCSAYAYRPGLCRLFGFAARRNKLGHKQIMTCKVLKDTASSAIDQAQQMIDKGLEAPSFNSLAHQVASIDPHHGTTLMPINQALQNAIEQRTLLARFKPHS